MQVNREPRIAAHKTDNTITQDKGSILADPYAFIIID